MPTLSSDFQCTTAIRQVPFARTSRDLSFICLPSHSKTFVLIGRVDAVVCYSTVVTGLSWKNIWAGWCLMGHSPNLSQTPSCLCHLTYFYSSS